VRVLLDTHLLLWALSQPSRLSKQIRSRIDSADVYISAASIWEIAIKSSAGRLIANVAQVRAAMDEAGFETLSINDDHVAKVADLPPLHRDPFDRLLVAQALVEPMLLLTNDEALLPYGTFVTLG
jgi:PIN domain nuclease of toxin-antitoxin system